ncbi:MAG: hypothetical protein HUU19_10330 [Phycisphaerales bacterium]|nr:hypothetical protein [Phycisphaerales bacterium]
MPTPAEALDAAIQEVTGARTRVTKIKSKQVRGVDEVASLKSTANAWFKSHRPVAAQAVSAADIAAIDTQYQIVLDSAEKHAAKQTYLSALKAGKDLLVAARGGVLTAPVSPAASPTDDLPPDFSPLVGNQDMRDILTRRWHECCKCVAANAHLAAIVMMGGLLEALFVARANKMPDKKPLISAAAAPKDKATGRVQNYQDWMLDSYIKVAHELRWITESAKDVADVLKEYRNYIHPEKERRHGVVLALNDSSMFWQVTKALARQLLLSATTP